MYDVKYWEGLLSSLRSQYIGGDFAITDQQGTLRGPLRDIRVQNEQLFITLEWCAWRSSQAGALWIERPRSRSLCILLDLCDQLTMTPGKLTFNMRSNTGTTAPVTATVTLFSKNSEDKLDRAQVS